MVHHTHIKYRGVNSFSKFLQNKTVDKSDLSKLFLNNPDPNRTVLFPNSSLLHNRDDSNSSLLINNNFLSKNNNLQPISKQHSSSNLRHRGSSLSSKISSSFQIHDSQTWKGRSKTSKKLSRIF